MSDGERLGRRLLTVFAALWAAAVVGHLAAVVWWTRLSTAQAEAAWRGLTAASATLGVVRATLVAVMVVGWLLLRRAGTGGARGALVAASWWLAAAVAGAAGAPSLVPPPLRLLLQENLVILAAWPVLMLALHRSARPPTAAMALGWLGWGLYGAGYALFLWRAAGFGTLTTVAVMAGGEALWAVGLGWAAHRGIPLRAGSLTATNS